MPCAKAQSHHGAKPETAPTRGAGADIPCGWPRLQVHCRCLWRDPGEVNLPCRDEASQSAPTLAGRSAFRHLLDRVEDEWIRRWRDQLWPRPSARSRARAGRKASASYMTSAAAGARSLSRTSAPDRLTRPTFAPPRGRFLLRRCQPAPPMSFASDGVRPCNGNCNRPARCRKSPPTNGARHRPGNGPSTTGPRSNSLPTGFLAVRCCRAKSPTLAVRKIGAFDRPEPFRPAARCPAITPWEDIMKGIIAWLLGVPVVVIVLLYLLDIF